MLEGIIPGAYLRYVPLAVFSLVLFIVIYATVKILRKIKIHKQLGISIRTIFSKNAAKEVIDKQKETAKAMKKYTDFKEFLFDLPKYSIRDDALSKATRALLNTMGVQFQPFIFFDQTLGKAKTAWIRYTGDMLYHENGAYFPPFKLGIDVIPYDAHDCRPLLDTTEEMEWRNPEMCADIVRAKINFEQRKRVHEDTMPQMYLIIGFLVIVVAIIAATYYLDQRITANTQMLVEQAKSLIEQNGATKI